MIRHLIRKCWFALAILVILAAIVFSLLRALTPWAAQYKADVEARLTSMLEQPVTIQTMETSWYWFEPVLKLTDIHVTDAQGQSLHLEQLLVGVNVVKSLLHWKIEPGILYLNGINLTAHQTTAGWQIDGLNSAEKNTAATQSEAWLPVAGWLLAQEKTILKRVSVRAQLLNGAQLPLTGVQLTATNHSGHYRLRGSAKLAQTVPTQFMLLADLNLDLNSWRKTKGRVWLSVEDFLPAQWHGLLPSSQIQATSGRGDAELWLKVTQGEVKLAQAQLEFEQLGWSDTHSNTHHLLQHLEGNLAWAKGSEGWQLSGDGVKLSTSGTAWPENQFQLEYSKLQDSYRVFVKTIPLSLALREGSRVEFLQPVLAYQPYGELKNTQLEISQGELTHLLTRFRRFGWSSTPEIPGVESLSGVFEWRPDEGRLDFDSDGVFISPHDLPPVTLTQLNGALHWVRQEQNWEVQLERFLLSHPDLKVSAQGGMIKPPILQEGRVDLDVGFSGTDVQQWFAYLPAGLLKPKLDDWLKHNVKRLATVNGKVKLHGLLADFPFDDGSGEFSVTARLQQAELMITPEWPLNRQIDAWLQLSGRNLAVDVVQAKLDQLNLTQVNLKLDDIGLDKETLLLRTVLQAPSKNMMQYVLKTPLRHSLSRLNGLEAQGELGLDLTLEIPLYPENDDVLVRGILTFDKNQLLVQHAVKHIELDALSGQLKFNKEGITSSTLQAILFDEPVQLNIQSIHQGVPRTEIKLQTKANVASLSKRLHVSEPSKVAGTMDVRGVLTLTDDPKAFDRLELESTLEGVTINLPPPFGKKPKEKTPFTLGLGFHPDKAPEVGFDYKKRVSGALRFKKSEQDTVLYSGQIQLGGGNVKPADKPGVYLSGRLPAFDLSLWQSELKSNSSQASPQWVSEFKAAEVTFDRLKAWGNEYKNMTLGWSRADEPDTWNIQVRNAEAQASLSYQTSTNTLSGDFQYLYLPDAFFTARAQENKALSAIKPSTIPNLDLAIEQFKIGATDLGHLLLKTTSTADTWQINSCVIQSPLYKLNAKGAWVVKENTNNTQLTAELKLTDLGGNLKKWGVSPVVEARLGKVHLEGQWPGGPQSFALARLQGSMNMAFKKGRITQLSPETEGKLGLGKLLSILSLQTIPRRLMLDFSDLSNTGYSFDIFSGNFKLNQGIMSTQDSYIDGPVAYVAMRGDLDLVKRLYNLELQISPHITASLPIVATIAGGPVAGVATWLAGKVINQSMQKISSYTYNITGPWLEPVLQQGNVVEKPN